MALSVLEILVWVIGLYLLVDFIAGFVHWAEDTLGNVDTPIWGPMFVAPNIIHHSKPLEMNKIHWFKNNIPVYVICIIVLAVGSWLAGLNWKLALFVFFGLFAQQTHRWAHTPRKILPKYILYLQRLKILQDGKHHYKHHQNDHDTHFCVGTPWVNPILDKIEFWHWMERLFVPIFGAARRKDLARYPWYRDRAIWAKI